MVRFHLDLHKLVAFTFALHAPVYRYNIYLLCICDYADAYVCAYASIHVVHVCFADNSSDIEKESLRQEIELGKSLNGDRHSNIVNFLGCVSTSGETL